MDDVKDSLEPGASIDPCERLEEDVPISKDEIFDVLKNHRRRATLNYLNQFEDEDRKFYLMDLSEQVAAAEHGKPPEDLTDHERKKTYVALYQSHLPKMQQVGLIGYDKDRGEVEKGPYFDTATAYLCGEIGSPVDQAGEERSFLDRISSRFNDYF